MTIKLSDIDKLKKIYPYSDASILKRVDEIAETVREQCLLEKTSGIISLVCERVRRGMVAWYDWYD